MTSILELDYCSLIMFTYLPSSVSLIKAVAENPQFIALISEDIRTTINRMVSQGAYHKSAMMEDPMVLEL